MLGELENEKKTFADEDTTEEKAKAEYRAIAERRVRLGLVIAEIGEKNNITVTDEELSRAIMEQARQFAGQEQQVWDYLPPESAGGGRAARADLRGKGGRLPARARQVTERRCRARSSTRKTNRRGLSAADAPCGGRIVENRSSRTPR